MRISKTTQRILISLLTLVAFVLRSFRLDVQSYWIDEGWTLHYANLSPEQLWHVLQTTKIVPPLYHFATLYWSRLLGDGEFVMRFLSLVFGVMAVPLIYRLGKALGDDRLGIVAATLMTAAPYQIWHAQDARNYTMLTAASILSMWGFVNMWQRGGWRWRLMYILGTEWALMTHYHGVILIGIQGLFLLLTWRRHWRRYLEWGACVLVILLLFAPWLVFGMNLLQSYLNWIPQPALWETYVRSAVAYSVGELVPRPQSLLLTAIFVAVYVLGLIHAARRPWGAWRGRQMLAFLLSYTLAPNLAAWLYGEARTPVYLERYLIVVQVGFLLTIGIGVLAPADSLRKRIKWGSIQRVVIPALSAISLASLLVAINVWVLNHHYFDPAYAKPDWRAVAQRIEDFELPGDAIIVTGDGGEMLFDYYYHGNLPIYLDFNTPVPPEEEAIRILEDISTGHRRVWYTPYGVDIDARLESWLATHAYPAWQSWIGRKRLALYAGAAGAPDQSEGAPNLEEVEVFFEQEIPDPGGEGSRKVGLQLAEVSQTNEPVAAGDVVPLTSTWLATTDLNVDYGLSLRLINEKADVFTQSDWPPLAAVSGTSAWEPGLPITDRRGVWLSPDTPPGTYFLEAVIYDPLTGKQLGQPAPVAQLAVEAAELTTPVRALSIPNQIREPVGDLTLVGYALPNSLRPGSDMWTWLYWQAPQGGRVVSPETGIRLRLTANDVSVYQDFSLIDSIGPTDGWLPGQVRRGVYHLSTNPRLSGDEAQLDLIPIFASQVSDTGQPGGASVSLGAIQLDQRPHVFKAPAIPQPTNVALGDPPVIKLIGYAMPAGHGTPGTPLPINLYWQAVSETEIDYTVFVQLLSQDWRVMAQQDMQPLAGEAPTSSWVSGEILTDAYRLVLPADLPDGEYRLITGMYDVTSGARLPVSGGGDFIALGSVTVP